MKDEDIVEGYIRKMYSNKNILGFNPIKMIKKLGVDVTSMLKVCKKLEDEGILKLRVIFNCECGNSVIGDFDTIEGGCKWCGEKVSIHNIKTEREFIRSDYE